jgi:catalase (peroxidase I)
VFVELAWQCASTYRRTDYLGGCNGARLRFAPQSTWSTSVGLSDALKLLQPIQASFQGLSLSDLIVFAAQVAIEDASGLQLTFCPGRVDASEGGSAHLNAPLNDAATDANNQMVRQRLDLLNLSVREWVALSARMRSRTLMNLRGYGSNSWSTTGASVLSNQYFASMLKYNWVNDTSTGKFQYRASDSQTPIFITPADHNLIAAGQNDYAGVVQEYSFDNSAFLADFASAWQKLMNADRFDGPTRNLCSAPVTPAPLPETERPWFVALMTFISTLMLVGVMFLVIRKCHSSEMHTHLPVAQHDHLESDGRPLFSPI